MASEEELHLIMGMTAWIHQNPAKWGIASRLVVGLGWGLVGRSLLVGCLTGILWGLLSYAIERMR